LGRATGGRKGYHIAARLVTRRTDTGTVAKEYAFTERSASYARRLAEHFLKGWEEGNGSTGFSAELVLRSS